MKTLIVYESMFGNTRMIAEAVAEALRSTGGDVTVAVAAEAPADLGGYDLVVAGAPTHAHTLPQPSSRTQAVSWADDPDKKLKIEAAAQKPGIREWLDGIVVPEPTPRFAAFSTRADIPRIFAGDASAAIKRRLHKRDIGLDAREDFLVDMDSHLVDGEEQRAKAWALKLAPVASARG